MKNLSALGNDPTYLSRYETIRNSKRLPVRPTLIAHQDQIAARYLELLDRAAGDDLENIGNSPLIAIRSQLRSCYDVKTKGLLDLKKSIKEAQLERRLKYCPYCCTTKNETHDHYLPATRFPEFAVNGFNLVPCCFKCNAIKDDDWLDADGRRRYVHFYLDEIPDVEFLEVELLIAPPLRGVGAKFSLKQGEVDDDDWRLIEAHFDRLHLIDRYNEDANDEIAEMLEAGAIHRQTGGPEVRNFFLNLAQASGDVFGRSNWRAVLLRALADHPHVEDWVDEFL